MVICLERGADLHIAQLIPLPLTISCSSKSRLGFTRMVLLFWCRLIRVVMKKRPLNECSSSNSNYKRLDSTLFIMFLQKFISSYQYIYDIILLIDFITRTHTTVLRILSGTTRVSQYQKKHSPTHTYYGHQSSLICFIHLV